MAGQVFISHSSKDDPIVQALTAELQAYGTTVWDDGHQLAAGDLLAPQIREAIEDSDALLAVISANAVNSKWVRIEIDGALRLGRRVIPLLLPPLEAGALPLFFGDDVDAEPVALFFDPEHETLDDLMPRLRVALGQIEPELPEPVEQPDAPPIAELIVELDSPRVDGEDKERRAQASARLVYRPAVGSGEREVTSSRFTVRAPIGPIEAGDLAWYLEHFAIWPSRHFRPRADAVEEALTAWGRALFDALDHEKARGVWEAFRNVASGVDRVLSIRVDPEVDEERDDVTVAQESATVLLGLPWELLHDGTAYLAAGARGVRVRRRLPNRGGVRPLVTATPVRVLVVSPRPEDDKAAYIDHRVSARPLVEAFATLGGRVELEILDTPTLAGLSDALATSKDRPYHAVHFDGHGIYSQQHGLGGLCFEDPADADKLDNRRTDLVLADKLAEILRDHRVPLVVLEACQSAMSNTDPSASVAGRLLRGGVASVVAMSHSVLVATARRFVEAFYRQLSAGAPVGAALLAAQRRLRDDPYRGRSFFGDLRLQDWFVPVLYQEETDPQLVRELPGRAVRDDIALRAAKAVEGVPATPDHGFVGRSRELLRVERLLVREHYAVLVGEGGQGKTTLAVELARWLVLSRRFDAAAFVSVEDGRSRDARAVLSAFGAQLVPGFGSETDFDRMWALLERRLKERRTLLIFDNMESILPPVEGDPLAEGVFEPEILDEVLRLAKRCSEVADTRVVFTTRSELPAPLSKAGNIVRIGRLGRDEAVELVAQVLGVDVGEAQDDDGDIEVLVETAGRHARSLVLLAQEVRRAGVRATTKGLRELMVTMAARFPEDRERSLFASVELSLQRLPSELRPTLRRLGVFQGGGHGAVIAQVLRLDYKNDEEIALGNLLAEVGLAERFPYQHWRLHPALAPMMLRELDETERTEAYALWVEAMIALTGYLNQQQSQDAQLSATLTLLELPNLLAMIDTLAHWLGTAAMPADRVVTIATSLEELFRNLGRPKALLRVVAVRTMASDHLSEWGYARFLSEDATIDRLLEAGRLDEALAASSNVLNHARHASPADGQEVYTGASYHLAIALAKQGRILSMRGQAGVALGFFLEAQELFTRLAEEGSGDAERMALVCSAEMGDALRSLGQLDKAAASYQVSIDGGERLGDHRQVAVGKMQLASVWLYQRRYQEALHAYDEAREIFEGLGEPGSIAAIWHQIGRVHEEMKQFEAAERAYRQSLAIEVQRGDRPGEATSIDQLGLLYGGMGRIEDSVRFHRDAATIRHDIGDLFSEGKSRNNLAMQLIRLERFGEARQEILRAIECKRPFGHAATPWTSFNILYNLEMIEENQAAAAEARERAIEAFLAYRRDGGENLTGGATGRLCQLVGHALASGEQEAARAQLAQLAAQPDLPTYLTSVVPVLNAILDGSRDPALASNPALDFDDAAEIRLLIEQLG